MHHRTHHHHSAGSGLPIERLESRYLLAVGVFENNQDIGAPAAAGAATYADGTYTISGAGADIGGISDQFHFAFSPVEGDGSITARVTSLLNTHASAKAGLMMRSGVGASAAFAGIFVTPASGLTFIVRTPDGAAAGQTTTFGFQAPRYLRLSHSGGVVSAYHSATGAEWTQLGTSQPVALGAAALVGLAVTSRNVSTTTTATFTGVNVLLPEGWSGSDIGAVTLPGWTHFNPRNNRFVLSGAGAGIGGSADQLHLASQQMTGEGSVIARIDELSATNPSARAGVMIRDGLSGGAAFASLTLTAQSGLAFQWRSIAGAMAMTATLPGVAGPVWLKLTRQGSQDGRISAHYAGADLQWQPVGTSQTIGLSRATALAGLAVTSGDSMALAAGTFSGVTVVPHAWSVADIGSASLPGSARYDPPSNTHWLSGSGSGTGGTSDQLTFASRDLSGDGSVVAYIDSFSAADPSAKAGVMLRAGTAPDAPFAGLFVSAQEGMVFTWRATAGAAAEQSAALMVAAPVTLRLTRTGNNFTPQYSTNGINFFPVGPTRILPMPAALAAGLAVASGDPNVLVRVSFTGASAARTPPPGAGIYSAADELFLHDLEQRSVQFFWSETNPATGLVPDGSSANGGSPSAASSIAAVGFGLTALTIGDRRGWLTHAEAYQRALNTVNFLYTNGAHVNGFFYHFLHPATGQRFGTSELSSIDTALLMAGVLNVAQYWEDTPLQAAAMNLFNRVNWPWMQQPNGQFYGEWTPEFGFQYGYGDFSEAVLLYLLGLGSSTHPIPASSWLSWSRTPVINYAGLTFVTAQTRALFTVQYPQGWFDLRGLVDSTGLNYYVNSQFATLAQRQMFIDLSPTWPHYGANLWGATAADGPSGYTVWGGPPPTPNIDGSVVPTAPGGSLAFTPRYSVDALRHMHQTFGSTVYRKYGFVDAFNPHTNWTSSIVLGIDVGMMLLAAENARSGFVWEVFNQTPAARQAMATAFPSIRPTLLAAVSRKSSAAAGTSDLPLRLSGDPSIENRQDGPTQLVLTFGANIVRGPNFAASLLDSGGAPNGSVSSTSVSGSILTINLSGVRDADTLIVNLTDIRHNAGSASGNYALALGVLLADANQDGAVNLADFNILAANFGQSPRDFTQGDFNSDATVNLGDFNLLAGQFGKSLPAPGASVTIPAGSPFSGAYGSVTGGRVPSSDALDEGDDEVDLLLRRELEPSLF